MQHQLESKFTLQGFHHALNIFSHPTETCGNNRKLKCIAFRYLFQSLKMYGNIYRNYPTEKALRDRCISEFELAFREHDQVGMAELGDIYYTFSTEGRGELLRRVRDMATNEALPKKIHSTIYSDSQNVHNSTLNKSVISVAKTLVQQHKELIEADEKNIFRNILNELIHKHPEKTNIIKEGFSFMSESVFRIDDITLPKVLIAVWLFITEHSDKKELENRLLEELKEMKGKCTTGYIARLVNVIQGYTDNKDFFVKISDKDQCRAVVRSYLMKKISECKDEKILEAMIENTEDPEYLRFIRKVVSERLIVWKKDYGEESLELIGSIVNEFAGSKVFNL